MRRKPTIKSGPATNFGMTGEIIREFSDGKSGGLISIGRHHDGTLRVQLYNLDADVSVVVPFANLDADACNVVIRPTVAP